MRHGRRSLTFLVPSALLTLTLGSGTALADPTASSAAETHPARTLERVTVTGGRPSTLPPRNTHHHRRHHRRADRTQHQRDRLRRTR